MAFRSDWNQKGRHISIKTSAMPSTLLWGIPPDVGEALAKANIAPRSAEIMVKPGIVKGPKASRHALAGDALSKTEWSSLPELLQSPRAVLKDERSGNLIFIVGVRSQDGRIVQLVVEVEREISDRRSANVVVSAYKPRVSDLKVGSSASCLR